MYILSVLKGSRQEPGWIEQFDGCFQLSPPLYSVQHLVVFTYFCPLNLASSLMFDSPCFEVCFDVDDPGESKNLY